MFFPFQFVFGSIILSQKKRNCKRFCEIFQKLNQKAPHFHSAVQKSKGWTAF